MEISPAPHEALEHDRVAKRCLAIEANMLAEARADIAAGRVVSLEDVEEWVESWDTDSELTVPASSQ